MNARPCKEIVYRKGRLRNFINNGKVRIRCEGCNTKKLYRLIQTEGRTLRSAPTQVRPYRYIAHQKIGRVGANLCVCPIGDPAVVVR